MASEDWDSYETGPFCRHWCVPSDCDVICARCGHKCTEHDVDTPSECIVDGCECKSFEDEHAT